MKRTTISITEDQEKDLAKLAKGMDIDMSRLIRMHLDAVKDMAVNLPLENVRRNLQPGTNYLLDSSERLSNKRV